MKECNDVQNYFFKVVARNVASISVSRKSQVASRSRSACGLRGVKRLTWLVCITDYPSSVPQPPSGRCYEQGAGVPLPRQVGPRSTSSCITAPRFCQIFQPTPFFSRFPQTSNMSLPSWGRLAIFPFETFPKYFEGRCIHFSERIKVTPLCFALAELSQSYFSTMCIMFSSVESSTK